jgi:hypothetical protein
MLSARQSTLAPREGLGLLRNPFAQRRACASEVLFTTFRDSKDLCSGLSRFERSLTSRNGKDELLPGPRILEVNRKHDLAAGDGRLPIGRQNISLSQFDLPRIYSLNSSTLQSFAIGLFEPPLFETRII